MVPRSYEQTWFWLICGHPAPKPDPHNLWQEQRDRRFSRLARILVQSEAGMSAAAIAQTEGWSKGYTWQQLRWARRYRTYPRLAHYFTEARDG